MSIILKLMRSRAFLLSVAMLSGCTTPDPAATHPVPVANFRTPNVMSLSQLPDDVKRAYLDEYRPFNHVALDGLPVAERNQLKSYPFDIVDRETEWTPGCSSGSRFVSASQTADGWYIIHESGGFGGNTTTLSFADTTTHPIRVIQIMNWQPPAK